VSSLVAVLDACVLVPAATRDLLLRAAEAGLYQARWSEEILAELARTIVRLFEDRKLPDAAGKARHLLAEMRANLPETIVDGYERLIPVMTNDPKDRHVVAAAVVVRARCIVTENLKDFPEAALGPHRLKAMGADTFVQELFALDPDAICAVIVEQGADLRKPRSFDEQLDYLARQLPGLVAVVRAYVADTSR